MSARTSSSHFSANSERFHHYRRQLGHFTYTKRKPILITVVAVFILLSFFGAILAVILTKTVISRKTNPNAAIVTFTFHVGYRKEGVVRKKRSLDADPVDPGQQVLVNTVQGLEGSIRNGSVLVTFVPYADYVLKDRVQESLSDYDKILDVITAMFQNKHLLQNDPSQYDAVNFYLDKAGDSSTSERAAKFAADDSKGNDNFVFVAPESKWYRRVLCLLPSAHSSPFSSNESRLHDSGETGVLLNTAIKLAKKTFLVGLDNDQDMSADYGLDDTSVQILPNGPDDTDQIVHGIEDPAPPSTTVLPSTSSSSTPTSTSTSTSTRIPTTSSSTSSTSSSTSTTTRRTTTTTTTLQPEATTTLEPEATTEFPSTASGELIAEEEYYAQ
ncbi:hypothetical protein M3Y99_01711000 [Aphelenchoides fujianensis]|nr:hypothetical protein M3Y99_01711000 [Aphelenchoides fujianensis]